MHTSEEHLQREDSERREPKTNVKREDELGEKGMRAMAFILFSRTIGILVLIHASQRQKALHVHAQTLDNKHAYLTNNACQMRKQRLPSPAFG